MHSSQSLGTISRLFMSKFFLPKLNGFRFIFHEHIYIEDKVYNLKILFFHSIIRNVGNEVSRPNPCGSVHHCFNLIPIRQKFRFAVFRRTYHAINFKPNSFIVLCSSFSQKLIIEPILSFLRVITKLFKVAFCIRSVLYRA